MRHKTAEATEAQLLYALSYNMFQLKKHVQTFFIPLLHTSVNFQQTQLQPIKHAHNLIPKCMTFSHRMQAQFVAICMIYQTIRRTVTASHRKITLNLSDEIKKKPIVVNSTQIKNLKTSLEQLVKTNTARMQ